jgi:Spx/MgsR family transcriptional regulator
MKIYGIPNCNTVKKTLDWFKIHQIEYEFHDFKKLGISNDKLEEWAEKLGWEALLNKRGTTWKMLDADVQSTIVSQKTAIELMKEKTSLIKRPVIETGSGSVFLGYNEDQLSELLK